MFAENFDPMFADFGTPASFTVGGAARSTDVIFEQPYAAPFDGLVDAAAPQCVGRSAALAGLQRGDAITIGAAAYEISSAQPDGTGLTRLVLFAPGA